MAVLIFGISTHDSLSSALGPSQFVALSVPLPEIGLLLTEGFATPRLREKPCLTLICLHAKYKSKVDRLCARIYSKFPFFKQSSFPPTTAWPSTVSADAAAEVPSIPSSPKAHYGSTVMAPL